MQHKEELKNTVLDINFDMTGVVMAKNMVFGFCDRQLIDHVVYEGKIRGIHFGSQMGLMPSDSTSFAIQGVPSMSFGTDTPRGGAEIHRRRDTMENMHPEELDIIISFVCHFAEEIANASMNVVPRELPKEVMDEKEKMQKMFGLED